MPSKIGDYEIICTIGSGTFGKCNKIRRKIDGKIMAWKAIDYGSMSETEKQMLVSEVNLLRELRHEFIVRYYDRIIDRNSTMIYIIMEYCEGGDLRTLISRCQKDRKYLEECFAWKILWQITVALNECQQRVKGRSKGHVVLHRDLKPANVFLDSGHNVKLGDFGLARVLHHDTSFAKTVVGTPYYMSPELMDHTSYNEKSDMWSLGCLLYELCSLSPPFTALTQQDLAVKIKEGKFRALPSQYSTDIQDFISRMLKINPDLRPSIEDILKHPRILELSQPKKDSHGSNHSNDDTAKRYQEKLEKIERREDALKRREEAVQKREESVRQREESVRLREKQIEERIRQMEIDKKQLTASLENAKERLGRAESQISLYQLARLQYNDRVKELQAEKDYQDDVHPSCLPTTPKRVHFAPLAPGKENMPPTRANDANPTSEKTADKKAAHLKERLYKAKLRSVALQKEEQMAKYKSKLLMNMMR